MRTATLVLPVLAFIPVGCISSVKPLATDDVVAFDEELIGEWVDAHPASRDAHLALRQEPGRAIVTADGRGYKIETSSPRENQSHSARLVQFGDVRILDLSPGKQFDTVPCHQFYLLSVSNDILTLRIIDAKKFREVVNLNEPTLPVGDAGNLNWTSKQLQDFFRRYSDSVFSSTPFVSLKKVDNGDR
jgi:hypothetical protein